MDLKFYLSLFLRQLHWFLLMVIVFSGLGIAVALILPTKYMAEARLLVESEQIPGELAASTVQTQASEQLQIIQQRILTRDILIEMANELDIYEERVTQGKRPFTGEEIVDDLRDRVSISVTGASRSRGEAQATIVSVSFDAPDAQLTANVTNKLVTLILEQDVSMRTSVARQTLEFFEQEVAALEVELSKKSAAILEFKEANLSSLPDSLDFRRTSQSAAQERLQLAERGAAELRDRRDRLKRLHESIAVANGTEPGVQASPEETQLVAAKDERAKLVAVLSPENPKVRILDAQIEALQTIVDKKKTANAQTDASGAPMTAYDIQIADLEGQISYLDDQKRQIQLEIDTLTETIENTPANAILLDSLERDYAAVQAQYSQAIANKAKAETGDTIEALSKGQRISIIEQAIAPREPTSPNRPAIAAGGVFGGIILGLGLVALIEILKSGIRRPADLTKGLGIAPFSTLPYVRSPGETLRRRTLVAGALIGAIAAVAGGLWATDTFYMPLDLLLLQIQQKLT